MTILFFIGGPNYHSQRSFKSFWNLGHIIYFALFSLLLFSVSIKKRHQPGLEITTTLVIALFLGTLVELMQYNFNRTPDLGDIFRNMIGASFAICFLLPIRKSAPKIPLLICKSIIIIMVLSQFHPIVISLVDEYHARRDFPIMSDFQDSLQIKRWTGDAAFTIEEIAHQKSNRAMRVDLTTETYSGVHLKYFPIDWQQYQRFQFRIYNPSAEAITITCRIHDKKHTQGSQEYNDRFNKTYSILQGWNTITISLKEVQQAPDKREIDLSQIFGVGIFASRLIHPRTIYIDDVRLL